MVTHLPLLLCMLLIPGAVQSYAAFSQRSQLHSQSRSQFRLTRSSLSFNEKFDQQRHHALFSSRDEEIADLEEKLQRLKEAAETDASTGNPDTSKGEFAERRFKISDDSTNMMVTGEELPKRSAVEPYEELLSEQWKVRDSGGIDIKDLFVKIASVVAILAGIVAFSQVPIGQEGLDRYSTAKPSKLIDLGDLNPVGENEP